ncbi:hypothetical protein PybrP1_003884 [[Pythium] brassicae (nom. inval.)]|nr:hypothetical protein PybrP1_003884 [[Pythium] brassicae (nom. inval.)]
MKVDELHAPAVTAAATTTPQRSLTDKIGEALVHTVEFLVPPLKRSLAWDSSEFDPMFPDWYMNTHPKQQATATSIGDAALGHLTEALVFIVEHVIPRVHKFLSWDAESSNLGPILPELSAPTAYASGKPSSTFDSVPLAPVA